MNESYSGKNKIGAAQQKVPKHWKPFCFCQHNWLQAGRFSILQQRIELVSSGWLNFDAQEASKIKFAKDKFTRIKRKIVIKKFVRGVKVSIAHYYEIMDLGSNTFGNPLIQKDLRN